MKEHYGINVPSSTTRLITEKHAYKAAKLKKTEADHENVKQSHELWANRNVPSTLYPSNFMLWESRKKANKEIIYGSS